MAMGAGDSGLTPEEQGLFAEAVSDVRPLAHDVHQPEPVYLQPVPISAREAEALRELDALLNGPAPLAWRDPEQWIQGSVAGLDPRVLRQLCAGEFTVQGEIDLHGVDSHTARVRVERFLLDAAARRLRCVRIIHGRGRGSPQGVPVIKQQLPRWLSRGPARHWVLAYSSAAPKDGGAGASYVLLRQSLGR
jgi:DNA-nicking Smr family endonuclease